MEPGGVVDVFVGIGYQIIGVVYVVVVPVDAAETWGVRWRSVEVGWGWWERVQRRG